MDSASPLHLRILSQITDAIDRADRPEPIYDAALEGLLAGVRADRAAILLYDPDGVMRFKAWRGLSDEYRRAVEGHTPWSPDTLDPPPMMVPDVRAARELEGLRAVLDREGIRALAFIPLVHRGRVIGKFMLYSAAPIAYDEAEVAFAGAVARQIALGIARITHDLERAGLVEREQRALAEARAEAKFRALLESAPDGIVTADAAGRIAIVNSRIEELFGYRRDELVGRPIELLIPPRLRAEHVRHRERYAEEPRVRPMGPALDLVARRKDGVEFPCEISLSPVATDQGLMVTAVVRDVSDRRKLQEERAELLRRQIEQTEKERVQLRSFVLSEVSRLLAGSLDTAAFDPAATLGGMGRLVVPAVAEVFRLDLTGSQGELERVALEVAPGFGITAPEPLEAMIEQVSRTGIARHQEHDLLEHRAPGPQGPAAAMVVPLIARQRVIGVLACVRTAGRGWDSFDIELVHDLARRAAVAIDNAHLFREAQEANRIKDEFLATLSHELRTPLNAILGWAHLLRSGSLDDERCARATEVIERNARAQAQLIGDILDLSRITMGKLPLHVRSFALAPIVEAAVETTRLAAEARVVTLTLEMERDIQMSGDPDRMQQVVWNLVSNAVKFTESGGHVQIELDRAGALARLRVGDDGVGIAPAFLPHVFERFRQADPSTTRVRGGLGLGLAITRHLVELHGGTIEATSDGLGKGATFTVLLPIQSGVHAEGAPAGRAVSAAFASRHAPALEGISVLVVDDESEARELLKVLLQNEGARVITAGSAIEALDAVARTPCDLMLIDIAMPEADGYSLLRRIRGREMGQAPAIALTAYAREEDRARALAAGFRLHLAKPVEPDALLEAVARTAGRQRA